ncbi:MAG: hypothetical protein HKN23_17240 [Verrucomicrobiales bacterium]|nr:hypothetical protein [Verrucomicrobiales bacterium]
MGLPVSKGAEVAVAPATEPETAPKTTVPPVVSVDPKPASPRPVYTGAGNPPYVNDRLNLIAKNEATIAELEATLQSPDLDPTVARDHRRKIVALGNQNDELKIDIEIYKRNNHLE